MKKWLQENLSLAARLLLKRLLVGAVGAGLRAGASVVNFKRRLLRAAVKSGLDVHRVWKIEPEAEPLFAPPPDAPGLGAHDFLFMMDALSGRARPPGSPNAAPKVSVVIPVFNKVEYTFQCLRSLLREVDFAETEVVVVDNASTDETPRVLSYFEKFVRVVRNEENRGFVDACNQGAQVARGRYLVFLNNDTLVLPGWLTNLVETAENDSSVGAVGSLFLYPDGRVQEAGAGVWRSGEAFHYGWGEAAENRRYNFAREVDYCSGASLLIERELFEKLGGFDRRFAPAYYEDIDLCFGVRSLGRKVIFQPMSRVVHFEGATAGRDTSTGFKRFQEVNRAKFADKWRDVLAREHLEKDPARVEEAANRKRGPHVVVFDERIPTPDRDAGSGRMAAILRSLAKWSRPVFVPFSRPHGVEYEKLLWKEGIETADAVDYPRLLKERRFYAAVMSRPGVAEAVQGAVRRADPKIKIVFDMVDAYFVRLEREHALTRDERTAEEVARYRELERRLARASDVVWCNSSEDKRAMELEAPGVPIEVITTIHAPHGRGKSFDEREGLLFIGTLAHRPNADAVRFFVGEILPLVRESLPGVKLYVVGDNVPPDIAAYASEDVRVTGYVPDAAPFFEGARVMVVPLRYGAGVKGKVGESLAYGLPVVTTGVGAEGMGLTDGANALVADSPEEFAAAVVRLYRGRDLWQQLADNGYRHIEQHFSPRVVEEVINNSVRRLGGPALPEATRAVSPRPGVEV